MTNVVTVRNPADFRKYSCGAEGCQEHVYVPFPDGEAPDYLMNGYRPAPELPKPWGSSTVPLGEGNVTAYLCPFHTDAVIRLLYPSARQHVAPPFPSPVSVGPYR